MRKDGAAYHAAWLSLKIKQVSRCACHITCHVHACQSQENEGVVGQASGALLSILTTNWEGTTPRSISWPCPLASLWRQAPHEGLKDAPDRVRP